MIFPEIIIYNVLCSIISLLRNDLKENSVDSSTILYKILGVDENNSKVQMNFYNYYDQAKKMLSKEQNFSVNFGYNQEVAQFISLHIILPSEQGKIGIGADEGYIEEDITDANGEVIKKQQYYTQVFESTYQIMITSNNSLEVNITYNILKSMLLMLTSHLELMGIRTPSLSGNDIVMQDNIIPIPIFHKVINLSFVYEHNVPKLVQNEIVKKIVFELNAIDYDSTQMK